MLLRGEINDVSGRVCQHAQETLSAFINSDSNQQESQTIGYNCHQDSTSKSRAILEHSNQRSKAAKATKAAIEQQEKQEFSETNSAASIGFVTNGSVLQ